MKDEKPPCGGETEVATDAMVGFTSAFIEQFHKGMSKYGTVLTTFNGRSAYHDFLQELVDCLMYATQTRMELEQAKKDIEFIAQRLNNMCYKNEEFDAIEKRWGLVK